MANKVEASPQKHMSLSDSLSSGVCRTPLKRSRKRTRAGEHPSLRFRNHCKVVRGVRAGARVKGMPLYVIGRWPLSPSMPRRLSSPTRPRAQVVSRATSL